MVINPLINLSYAGDICFSENDAKQMLVQLESVADYKEQIELMKSANQELLKQIELLKQVNKLQVDQLTTYKKTIDAYDALLKSQKNAYEKQIENERPSIFGKIFAGVGGIGAGILIGLIL
ncbi:MAG: hypothetical protein WC188_04510 [Candidatus Caldatribacteriota bacterium]